MSGWQPIETAPKDGTWILLRGRNAVGIPMIPVVVAWNPVGLPARNRWVDSASGFDMTLLAVDVPPGHSADWHPLPTEKDQP